ncbi:MAG: 50S ribosomal protein L15 [Bacteroidota bacterium]
MKHIGNLKYAEGSRQKKKRIGRGQGSGHGGTSTKGHKGAQSRSGYASKRGFEGGQMPLSRRVPKFGFKNPFRVEYQVINIATLQELFDNNQLTDTVDMNILQDLNLINRKKPFKILGNGELKAKLNVTANKVSESARQKIESAGGSVTTDA